MGPPGRCLTCEDDGSARPVVAVKRRLRELSSSGAPATQTRVLRDWVVFLGAHVIGVFDGRDRLKAGGVCGLPGGPAGTRFAAVTWNRTWACVWSSFYWWAEAEGHAGVVPFSPQLLRAGAGSR